MPLIDNILILKKRYPAIWNSLKPFMEKIGESPFKLRESKSGLPTLIYEKDGESIFIHSAYDPRHEAEVFSRKLRESDTSAFNHVFFYGIGLGYHIEEFLSEHPDMFFSLYEPNPDAFCHFIMNRRLDDLPLRRLKSLYVPFKDTEAEGNTIDFFNRYHDRPFFVTLPAYERLFKEEYDKYKTFFTDAIGMILSNRYTTLAFEKRWTINSMLNFVTNLYNRNIFNHEEGMFKDKPAILVAAGPSLEDEYENIRRLKEEGKAYIFTVGSAIKGLIKNGIEPHGAISMDPGEFTYLTFKEIIDNKITTIPHIYGTSVGFQAVRNYPGPQLFMTMDKDHVTPYFLKNDDGTPTGMVNDAPTVAITAFQLLCLQGFNPIILVGQNLGFRNSQNYAKGIEYEAAGGSEKRDHMATASEIANIKYTEDVYGEEMQTSKMYNLFRKSLEYVINLFPGRTFINTTRGGAKIKGTSFSELDSLMQDRLMERVVDEEWLEKIKLGGYDMKYLIARKKKMSTALMHLKRRLEEMEKVLSELKSHIEFRNKRRLQEDFTRLDKIFSGILKNDFYRSFISPLNMLETAIFGNGMALVHKEIFHPERAVHIVANFGRYVMECKRDIKYITDVLYKYIGVNIDMFEKWTQDQAASNNIPLEVQLPELDGSFTQSEKDIL
jgi:hypothetical protein